MNRIINVKCACSPDRPTTGNEDVRLNYGAFERGRGVVDLAMRSALVDEVIDVGLGKPVGHIVECNTTGARRTLQAEVRWSNVPQL